MMRLVARGDGIASPTDMEVEAIVGVEATRRGFETEIELKIHLHSNAIRGNVPVRLVIG